MRAVLAGGDGLGRARLAVGGALALAAACQPEPSGPVSLPLTDAASMRVFTVQNNPQDWTAHIPLIEGEAVRLRVRVYTPGGREIVPLANPVSMSFSFAPSTLASATVADAALLTFDLAPVDTAGTDGSMTITLTEPSSATTKSFGPFFVLVH